MAETYGQRGEKAWALTTFYANGASLSLSDSTRPSESLLEKCLQ